MTDSDDRWRPRDALLGLLFLVAGTLVTTLVVLAMRSELPFRYAAVGWILGPVLVLLGLNAILRSLRS